MSKVKLSEFDLYGTFRLTKDETVGIENLVQKLSDNEYLSRNARYYPNIRYRDCLFFRDVCDEYERLNSLLPMDGKPAFVVCEKMHELAIRAVNTIQQMERVHLFHDGEHFDTVAQKCAQECADNLVRLINDQTAQPTATKLRDETHLRFNTFLNCKIIEADNKKQLYMCANALPDDTEHLLTPGRGSSKLGTLVQSVRQHKGLKPLGITQVYYSHYGNKQREAFPQPLKNLPEKLLVMDDIIYNGFTLSGIKRELTQQGHRVTNGAMAACFYNGGYDLAAVFNKKTWSKYIDIIPNQYAPIMDQADIMNCLHYCQRDGVNELNMLLNQPRNGSGRTTADYWSMQEAERMAHELDADLYHVSEKISPAAVEYNNKIRAQVEQYNAELHLQS